MTRRIRRTGSCQRGPVLQSNGGKDRRDLVVVTGVKVQLLVEGKGRRVAAERTDQFPRWQNSLGSARPLSPVESVVDLGHVHVDVSDVASQAGQELVHIADAAGAQKRKRMISRRCCGKSLFAPPDSPLYGTERVPVAVSVVLIEVKVAVFASSS